MLRARQKLGKYRILGRIASGPLADVYRAADTIHKTRVALKVPKLGNGIGSEDFLHEVQVAFKLDHPLNYLEQSGGMGAAGLFEVI